MSAAKTKTNILKGRKTMEEILTGFEAIRKHLGNPAEVEAVKIIKQMKIAGYAISKDLNGVWSVPASEIDRFFNGGEVPKQKAPEDADAEQEEQPGDGPFKMVHRGRGKWAVIGPGAEDIDETYTKEEASAMVAELNAEE